MTKFVLHGGFNKEIGFIKDDFFQEMLKEAPANAKVLFKDIQPDLETVLLHEYGTKVFYK